MTDSARDRGFAIGIDLGGTKIEVILIAPDGAALFRERIPVMGKDR